MIFEHSHSVVLSRPSVCVTNNVLLSDDCAVQCEVYQNCYVLYCLSRRTLITRVVLKCELVSACLDFCLNVLYLYIFNRFSLFVVRYFCVSCTFSLVFFVFGFQYQRKNSIPHFMVYIWVLSFIVCGPVWVRACVCSCYVTLRRIKID